jgi:hypothetical protein
VLFYGVVWLGFGGFLKRIYGYVLVFLLVGNFVVMVGCLGLMVYTTNEMESSFDISGLQRVYDNAFSLLWAFVLFQALVIFPLMYKHFG